MKHKFLDANEEFDCATQIIEVAMAEAVERPPRRAFLARVLLDRGPQQHLSGAGGPVLAEPG